MYSILSVSHSGWAHMKLLRCINVYGIVQSPDSPHHLGTTLQHLGLLWHTVWGNIHCGMQIPCDVTSTRVWQCVIGVQLETAPVNFIRKYFCFCPRYLSILAPSLDLLLASKSYVSQPGYSATNSTSVIEVSSASSRNAAGNASSPSSIPP